MIEIHHISKTFGTGERTFAALKDIHLSIRKGEIFGIIGHSGAGKSTLLRCLNALETPDTGHITIGDVNITGSSPRELQAHRQKIGMIFQHFHLLSSATVFDNIAFPMRLAGASKAQIQTKVKELAALVGLEGHLSRYPAQLSGGQKQRVGIARALANDPHVLLCDEATSALDPQTTDSILSLLLDINKKFHLTIVLITHEMHVIRSVCDRVAVIDGGRIVESGDVLDVFLRPQHPTTKQFVSQLGDVRGAEPLSGERARGTVLRITFQGEQTYEPVLFETVKETGMSFSILQGSISQMKNIPYGQLLVELHGDDGQAERTIQSLRKRGLEVEAMQ
ncbi:methionine ABC transporter ATP-binding protein [Paenibacillus thermotolerans]|uniref:methionine ABC transporter ATP-binding protein n=1 Tax=Paenibacillus thermotolerans TaxID=3027807 RepID=UPI00236766D6|nr:MULTISPECIES: methionine ABC transporter ATP-binding protein [unclassified Paenibacillus]